MPVLHNRISNEELKARMLAETEPRTTVSFYKYFTIDDPKAFRDSLYIQFDKLKVFGRIYVAKRASMRRSACRRVTLTRSKPCCLLRIRLWIRYA